MVGRTKPILKADRQRFEQLKQMPCIACDWMDAMFVCGRTEIHHLLSGGRRIGHQATVPMGAYHHRKVPLGGSSIEDMRKVFGPSIADGSKAFHERFPSDAELLELTNQKLQQESLCPTTA